MRLRSLVTGGAGFLGSHLCDRLIQEGHEVICLDNLLTGRIENLRHLMDHPRFFFVAHDATIPIDLDKMLDGALAKLNGGGHRLDFVLHLASPASPKDYQRYPIHTLKVGAVGTLNALGLAKRHGSVFLLASTSEVYGDPEVHPQAESYWGSVNPVGPRSCYDEAKRFAEALTMGYSREHNISTRIARIFNTYGERMRPNDGRVLPNFVLQALQHDPVTVYGDGSQTRSFCYVSDLIDGLFRLLVSDVRVPVNLGNPEEMSLLDFARLIIRETRSRSRMVFETLPQDDPQMRRPDISRAETLLGWRPRVTLKEGIRRTIPYFREFISRPAPERTPALISRPQPASAVRVDS